ncbi:retinol-binding protein pinta isoform X2 [Ptiloglossa arizonensis]|uniref:retinol-binding protein pinta isoform X2 n=1 Tax=Ptiloglossa arizonensis TaxID=3350558 RepID=UPI003FA0E9B6
MSTLEEYVCLLSAEEKAYVAANLNETDDIRAIKIAELRDYVTGNDDLCAPIDDFSMLRFLRASKFNVGKAKCKLYNYYKQRTNMPEWYSNRDPCLPQLQELFEIGILLPLKKLDNEGRMVVIIRAAAHTPSRHTMSDMLKAALMTLDLALKEHEMVTVHGITAILDIGGMTYEHVIQLSPSVIKSLVHAWQGCYPVRIHSLNFINAQRFVNVVLNIFRSFMNSKLKNRVHVYARGKLKLEETLPIDILPEEYGGTDGTVKELSEYWKRIVENNKEWFTEEEKYKLTLIK